MLVLKENFNIEIEGKEINIYYLKNQKISVAVTNYGARVVSFLIPDKNGMLTDIVVGFKSIADYLNADCPYYGAIIGRFANRISQGKFTLSDKNYNLDLNIAPNALHGGKKGFHNRVWDVINADESGIELCYVSEDGEEGYPGTLTTKVSYKLMDDNQFQIDYKLTTDKQTVINVTNHNFWNLNGEGSGSILDHDLMIKATKFIATDSAAIPIAVENVKDTPFDFTTFHKIGERINADHLQIKNGNGYDHTFVFDKGITQAAELCAIVKGNKSGIIMEVLTTEPGVQLYTGNFMQGKDIFKCGAKDDYRSAFCLETQHFPDSPNQPSFPTTVLEPGNVYKSTTVHKFEC